MWWKVSWSVLKNLVYISAIIWVFEKFNSAFESLTFSVLLLILQSVTWSNTHQLRFMIEESFGNKRVSFLILKKLGEEIGEAEEALTQEETNYKKLNPIYYINLVADAVLYLIILWKVFSTLLA